MRFIVIEDTPNHIVEIKESMEYEFSESAQSGAIFISSLADIQAKLKDLPANEKYVVLLDDSIPGGNSRDSISELKELSNVWGGIEQIYGISNHDNDQKKLIQNEFPELLGTIYTQSSKLELIPLIAEIAKTFPELTMDGENQEVRVM
jgi:DNA-binding NarL/FixJ family response regulator